MPSEMELRQAMQGRYDQLNALWQQAESEIKSYLCPRAVGLMVDAENREYFGWQRVKGSWRICFGEGQPGSDSGVIAWKPVLDCEVSVRVDMIPHYPTLRDHVVKECHNSLNELDDAIANMEAALKT